MQGWSIVLLALSSLHAVNSMRAENVGCVPPGADTIDLAGMNIFQTIVLENEQIDETIVQKQLDGTKLPQDYQTYVDTQTKFQALVEAGEASVEYGTFGNRSDSDTAAAAYKELYYYKPVCPYRYYWLSKYSWFFYNSAGNGKYCWAYYPIYVSRCTTRSCNWWFNTSPGWYHSYQCYPKYSYIWIYARCFTIKDRTWTNEYVRHAVPRGCSCKRLNFQFTIQRQCPAQRGK